MHPQLAPAGGFVVFRWETPTGARRCSAKVVRRSSGAFTAAALPGPQPPVGELATVQATGGTWTTRLVDAGGGQVLVALPAWARNGNRRGAVRVPVTLDAMWRRPRAPLWRSAQVLDLSVTGARLVTEDDPEHPVRPGDRWELNTVDGNVEVEIRGVSDHDFHHLLLVVGVRFVAASPAVAAKVRERVSRSRGRDTPLPEE